MAKGKLGNVLKIGKHQKRPVSKNCLDSMQGWCAYRLPIAADLFRAYDGHDHIWDYLPYGPFNSSAQYFRFVSELASQPDPYFVAIQNKQTGQYLGFNHICALIQTQAVLNLATYAYPRRATDAHFDRGVFSDDAVGL